MTRRQLEPDDERQLFFILPQYVAPLGHSCAKDYCAENPAYSCGCPLCLTEIGCTLAYNAEDWDPEAGLDQHWRKRIVSLRTGRLAAMMIVPGYPGYQPGPDVPRPIEVIPRTEDTPPAEPPPTPAPA